MGTNVLLNPELKGFNTPPREFVDKNGNKGWMENPDHWEYVWTPMHEDDPNLVPQSLHRDRGYCIAAGWRVWEAGYVQRGVPLRGGQRYLAKAVFQPDVNFNAGQQPDLTAVQWRFWIQTPDGSDKIWTEWQTTTKGQYKQQEEHLFVIESRRDMAVDFYFKARSIWASNVCDFNLYSLTLEDVPSDYGTPTYIGSPAAQPTGVANFSPVSSQPAVQPTSPAASTVFDLMTDDDLTVIIAGFRAAANLEQFGQETSQGFERFAQVLEKYQAQKFG